MPPSPELTLIVAATRDMGIGLNGTLPWTGLRKEMAYFARVTKRLPPQTEPPALNAVIMGRKTWESIPPKFRPLKGRLNIVISRSPSYASQLTTRLAQPPSSSNPNPAVPPSSGFSPQPSDEGPIHATSLDQALAQVAARKGARVFVIGGAQVYASALASRAARRVLLTRVLARGVECDTFFPIRLEEGLSGEDGTERGEREGNGKGEGGSREGKEPEGAQGWERKSKAEMDAWVGEEVPEGVQQEGGFEYQFEMWERVDGQQS